MSGLTRPASGWGSYLAEVAAELGRPLEGATVAAVSIWLDALVEWNAKIDLTAAKDPKALVWLMLADAMAPTRAHVLLIDVFGYVALCLALLGLYGAIAYAAGARRRDLAIRAAVGARRRDLRLLMVRDEFQPIGIGLVAGLLAGTAAVPAVMRSVSTTVSADRWTAVYVLIAMLLVSTGASYLASTRAGRAEPLDLLKD